MPRSISRFCLELCNHGLHLCDGLWRVGEQVAVGRGVLGCFYRPVVDAVVNPVAGDAQLFRQLWDRQEARDSTRV